MKKYISLLLLMSAILTTSCTYDYDMPDVSNVPVYVYADATEDLVREVLGAAEDYCREEYGFSTLTYSGHRYDCQLVLRDENDSIVSTKGVGATDLQSMQSVGASAYLCVNFENTDRSPIPLTAELQILDKGRVSKFDYTYYKICTAKVRKPITVYIDGATNGKNYVLFDVGDQYTMESGVSDVSEQYCFYQVSFSEFYWNVLVPDLESAGYDFDTFVNKLEDSYIIRELDSSGKQLYSQTLKKTNSDVIFSQQGAAQIELSIKVTDSKGNEIVTYAFEPYDLDGHMKTTTISVSASDSYSATWAN